MNYKNLGLLITILLFLSCGTDKETLPEPQQQSLKIMTYNIHIGNPPSKPEGVVDLIATAKVINGEKPDLVALQEVDVYTDRSGKNVHQAEELAKLTGMHYYFAKAINRSGGEYGVALLSRFPILKTEVHSLPVEEGSGAELRAAGIVEVEFFEGQKLYFVSTHFDHLTNRNRALQARKLLEAISPFSEYPVIVGGDFNMDPKNQNWELLGEELTMGCSSCPSTFPAGRPITTIDYILLNETATATFRVRDYYSVIDRYASDHLPVVTILEF